MKYFQNVKYKVGKNLAATLQKDFRI